MIKVKFSNFIEQKYNNRGEDHQLYILKGEGCVLYVEISRSSIWERWFSMPSSHLYWDGNGKLAFSSSSSAGEAVVRCQPESMNWVIELWTAEDCIKFLRVDEATKRMIIGDIHFAEDLMIKKLKPVLNIAGSSFRYGALPPRIKRYMQEQEDSFLSAYHRAFRDEK